MLRIILLLVLALSNVPAQTKSKTPPPQSATASQDLQIETEIRTRLARAVIGKDGFTVRVQGGVAYWEGTTDVAQHKGAATRMAKSAGAQKVVNNIRIGDDAKRRAQVKRSEPR